jgi:hypothetical protein
MYTAQPMLRIIDDLVLGGTRLPAAVVLLIHIEAARLPYCLCEV